MYHAKNHVSFVLLYVLLIAGRMCLPCRLLNVTLHAYTRLYKLCACIQDEAKDLQPEEKQKAAAEADFDVNQDKHRGQFALRKLYHESDRVLVVLYTSPTCGPCRTLKPIFSKVVDEYDKKVCTLKKLISYIYSCVTVIAAAAAFSHSLWILKHCFIELCDTV